MESANCVYVLYAVYIPIIEYKHKQLNSFVIYFLWFLNKYLSKKMTSIFLFCIFYWDFQSI